jgi:acyl carrier protein
MSSTHTTGTSTHTTGSSGSQDAAFKTELKKLIVAACNRDIDPQSIADDEQLVGRDARLALDSLDILQINVAIAQSFGARIDDSKHALRVMKTINTLADFIRPEDGHKRPGA